MNQIANIEFIEKYKPIKNCRFPTFGTIIPEDHILQPYIWDRREKLLLTEYIPNKCFFSVVRYLVGDQNTLEVHAGSDPALGIAWIITECAYRPEDLEYTVIEL